jgi:hypothetical protein
MTKRLNYFKANQIIEIYTALLGRVSEMHLYDKYSYEDMNGYDIIDIINSLSLMTAYQVFEISIIDDEKLVEFKKKSSEYSATIFLYFGQFISPDEKIELDKIDKTDIDSLLNSAIFQSDFTESYAWKVAMEKENIEAFLDFCIEIKGNSKYWQIVFQRLRLDCETNNEYDKIYFELKKEMLKEDIKTESKNKITKPKFYNLYKTDLVNLLFVAIFFLCLYNLTIRYIVFIFFILFGLFTTFITSNLLKEKQNYAGIMMYNLMMNIFMIIILSIGLFNQKNGYYVTIICLVMYGFELIRYFIKNHLLSKTHAAQNP